MRAKWLEGGLDVVGNTEDEDFDREEVMVSLYKVERVHSLI